MAFGGQLARGDGTERADVDVNTNIAGLIHLGTSCHATTATTAASVALAFHRWHWRASRSAADTTCRAGATQRPAPPSAVALIPSQAPAPLMLRLQLRLCLHSRAYSSSSASPPAPPPAPPLPSVPAAAPLALVMKALPSERNASETDARRDGSRSERRSKLNGGLEDSSMRQ